MAVGYGETDHHDGRVVERLLPSSHPGSEEQDREASPSGRFHLLKHSEPLKTAPTAGNQTFNTRTRIWGHFPFRQCKEMRGRLDSIFPNMVRKKE